MVLFAEACPVANEISAEFRGILPQSSFNDMVCIYCRLIASFPMPGNRDDTATVISFKDFPAEVLSGKQLFFHIYIPYSVFLGVPPYVIFGK
jgi:hypothetical protein